MELEEIKKMTIEETKEAIRAVEESPDARLFDKARLNSHLYNLREQIRAEYEPDIERPSFRFQRFTDQMNEMESPFANERRRRNHRNRRK